MDNFDLMKNRLVNAGGPQRERMLADRLKSLKKALKYSFESEEILKINETNSCRMLINPNQLKFSVDEKMVSIPFENSITTGDIFKWIFTDSYWLIYLQELTENAYFKGYAKKCSYMIKWEDGDGEIQSTWAAIEGPDESTLNPDFYKQEMVQEQPNSTLKFYIPNNDLTQDFCKKYTRFMLNSKVYRIVTIDDISKPKIISFVAIADFLNTFEDDITNQIVGGLIEEVVNPNSPTNPILGETFIRPRMEYTYTISEELATLWSIDSECDYVEIINETSTSITLTWISSVSGTFNLVNGEYSKEILVQSLF